MEGVARDHRIVRDNESFDGGRGGYFRKDLAGEGEEAEPRVGGDEGGEEVGVGGEGGELEEVGVEEGEEGRAGEGRGGEEEGGEGEEEGVGEGIVVAEEVAVEGEGGGVVAAGG